MITAALPPAWVREHGGGAVDDAPVHAAVEVPAGAPRSPARTRRRPAAGLAAFWARVGPERDRRPNG